MISYRSNARVAVVKAGPHPQPQQQRQQLELEIAILTEMEKTMREALGYAIRLNEQLALLRNEGK